MKIKQMIGKTINGFTILDTYAVNYPSGAIGRKVLLRCEDCGRKFERCSGQDFNTIKCKCKCKYLQPKKEKYHWIEHEGKKYIMTDFCREHDINVKTFQSRIDRGMSIDDAIKKIFTCECEICGKQFESNRPGITVCGKTCKRRKATGKGKYKQPFQAVCVICGKEFETTREDAKTCSESCRRSRDRIKRKGRYKHLEEIGRFDESVTLVNVFNRFNGECVLCKRKLNFEGSWVSDDYPSIDHIIPISKGGTHEWNNVQLLCRKCNYMKSNKIEPVFENVRSA